MTKNVRKLQNNYLSSSINIYDFTITEDGMRIYMNITKDFQLIHSELLTTINARKLTNCSKYFIELNVRRHDCIDSSFFIKLAEKIHFSYPNHQINWLNTFQVIEEYEYVKQVLLRQGDGELDEDDVSVHLTAPNKDGKRFPRKKECDMIREQVFSKLKRNNLIK